ncbi:TPA: hypothetical protein ACTV60_003204 [Klebsiella pneumoniae]|uniref:hypothetical protein n=1 Tax=Klebsiella pneumoniae TaxID=573 RepID=UPI0010346F34|nr:hypothetical protein [Klebsiella pneumoniae]HDS7266641.1 hypothetical protein [Klebsiella pneumoniae subsp. pneumoniae]EIX9196041.1 hypothetical protein [Klebsiella pneumoniae]EKU0361746.1 hypothetical protein [Klebsiella pneumoniae]GKJ93700.1 hypothetical protein NUBL21985_21580 [Klebsiella pneumoniae]HBS2436671.1 hypothetical protein [Klebsiella pneumoniae]
MEFFAIIVFFLAIAVITRWNNYKKLKKRKDEDKFLQSIDYSNRIPEVKSKPQNGRRRSKEQILADGNAYKKLMGDDFRVKAKAVQIQAERVGSKRYIWHGDDCCPSCNRQNGKTYAWSKPPKTGHPGEGKLCPNGYCRCWAEVIIPEPRRR